MYSREIDGQEFTFGVSGKLIMNVLVMYDRQTESLWAQLLGEAVEGDTAGVYPRGSYHLGSVDGYASGNLSAS